MQHEPLISIIVPIYNVGPYIRQCLESLMRQTYANIEIICVDDGSADNSGAVVDEYAARDNRIKPLHKQNAGVAAARNAGIEAAGGEYVMFVDGDDWAENASCAASMETALKIGADVVMWGYIREFEQKSLPRLPFETARVFHGAECAVLYRRMFGLIGSELRAPESADSLSTVWGKLYRADIIKDNSLCFCDLHRIGTYEDGLFNIEYFAHVKTAAYINECYYHYRKNSGMTAKYRPRLAAQWGELFADMGQIIARRKLGAEYEQALNNRIALSIIGLGLNAIMQQPAAAYAEIGRIITDCRYRAAVRTLPLKYFPPHWWVFFLCCKLRITLAVYFLLKCMDKMRG